MWIPCALLGAWTVDPGMWDAHGPLAGVVAILLVLLVLVMRLREQIPVIERGTRAWRINATLNTAIVLVGLVAVVLARM